MVKKILALISCLLLLNCVSATPYLKGVLASNYYEGTYRGCSLRNNIFYYSFEDPVNYQSRICSDNFHLTAPSCSNGNPPLYFYQRENVRVSTMNSYLVYSDPDGSYFYNVNFEQITAPRIYKEKGITILRQENIISLYLFSNSSCVGIPLSIQEVPTDIVIFDDWDLCIGRTSTDLVFIDLSIPRLRFQNQSSSEDAICNNSKLMYYGRKVYDIENNSWYDIDSRISEITTCTFNNGILYLGGVMTNNANIIEAFSTATLRSNYVFNYPVPVYSPNRDRINKIQIFDYNNALAIGAVSRGTQNITNPFANPELYIIFPSLNSYTNFTTTGELNDMDVYGDKVIICGVSDLYILQIEN